MTINPPDIDLFKPHQVDAVQRVMTVFDANQNAFLLADSVGLGKTRVACEVARRIGGRILVVAPLSTFSGWVNEAQAVGLPAIIANGMYPETDIAIVNYERLEKYPDKIGSFSGKTFKGMPFDLVIWDEAHKLKSYKSKRHNIWMGLRQSAKRMLYLTATPGQTPLELKYLGDVIGFHPVFEYWKWVKDFKGAFLNRWGGWDYKAGHLEDMRKLEKIVSGNPKAIRRLPSDIAGWPELQQVLNPVSLTHDQSDKYSRAFDDYLEGLKEAGGFLNNKVKALVAAGQFRKRISVLKSDYTVDLADTLIEQGHVVTISCEYLESVDKIQAGLSKLKRKVAVIRGDTAGQERMRILSESKIDLYDAIIFTVQEGINLQQFTTRPRIQINHDVRWSALAMTQIDGRTHRAGKNALVYWMVAANTIDERVSKRLLVRMKTLNVINGDSDNEFMSEALSIIEEGK